MKRRSAIAFLTASIVIAITVSTHVRLWLQRMELHTTVELARFEVAELAPLQAENRRLREKQIPGGELAVLRADHDPLPRLREQLADATRRISSFPADCRQPR